MTTRFSLIGALLLGVAAHGQTTGQYSDSGQSGSQNDGSYQSSGSSQSQGNRGATQVRRFNKASNLIGAEVRDQSNEPIGQVKDVVIDFNSGRVAYVVVDASDVLEGEQNCIAVPARVFRAPRGGNALMIDADRSRIEQMRAFSANNYPPIRNQSSQFANWRNQQNRSGNYQSSSSYNSQNQNKSYQSRGDNSDGDWYYYEWYLVPNSDDQGDSDSYAESTNPESHRYQGAYGQSQSGRSQENALNSSDSDDQSSSNSGPTGYNRYQPEQRQQGAQDSTERYSDQWQDQNSSQQNRSSSSATKSSNSAGSKRVSGSIRSVDADNRTLTIKSHDKTLQFQVANNATIKHNGAENADLSDLQPGQRVDIGYNSRNGTNRAFTINQHTQGASSTSSDSKSGSSSQSQQ